MRQLHRTTKQYIVTVFLSFLIIGIAFFVAYFILLKNTEKNYELQLSAMSNELASHQNTVYETISQIEVGTPITEEQLSLKEVYTSQAKDTFIGPEDLGKVALITIPAGVYLQKHMLVQSKIEDEVREVAYSCIQIASHIVENDWVDVRLFYPNGEDYIVLSKKAVQQCSEDRTQCYLWLTEEEILMMSSAIVDAYLYSGASIYCTKYVQPTIQAASIVNYQASLASLELIRTNPNIVEIASTALSVNLRKSLENRLADSIDNHVEDIQWEVTPTIQETTIHDTIQEEEFYYFSEEVKAKEEDVEYGE